MRLRKTGHSWTVNSAPIEFVLVGPRLDDYAANAADHQYENERDAVLVRTANLRPDLLALAIESREKDPPINLLLERVKLHEPWTPFDVLGSLFWRWERLPNRLRKLNAVRGEMFIPENHRGSNYVFAWVGKVDTFGKEVVEAAVRRYLADLRAGLQEGNPERIEWALAPVIYHCILVTTGMPAEHDQSRKYARQARLNSYFAILVAATSLFFALLNVIYLVTRMMNN